ncbi:hypothetical protein JD969_05680 [Planctomycetota bacterium]|nr:hypothetical protein JD969_05680 [Planctomycetota bacterium]
MNFTKLMTLIAVTFMTTAPALAQVQSVDDAPAGQIWLTVLLGVVMSALIIGASFLWSKRGHHD